MKEIVWLIDAGWEVQALKTLCQQHAQSHWVLCHGSDIEHVSSDPVLPESCLYLHSKTRNAHSAHYQGLEYAMTVSITL